MFRLVACGCNDSRPWKFVREVGLDSEVVFRSQWLCWSWQGVCHSVKRIPRQVLHALRRLGLKGGEPAPSAFRIGWQLAGCDRWRCCNSCRACCKCRKYNSEHSWVLWLVSPSWSDRWARKRLSEVGLDSAVVLCGYGLCWSWQRICD